MNLIEAIKSGRPYRQVGKRLYLTDPFRYFTYMEVIAEYEIKKDDSPMEEEPPYFLTAKADLLETYRDLEEIF